MSKKRGLIISGLVSLVLPGVLLALPYIFDSRSHMKMASFHIPNLVYVVVLILAAAIPIVCGIWLVSGWFKAKKSGENGRAAFLVLGILNFLTLPLLVVMWLVLSLMSFGFEISMPG